MFPNILNNDEARAFFKENGYPEQYNDGLLVYLRETYPFAGGQTLPDLLARHLNEYGDTFNMIIAGKSAANLAFIEPAATFTSTTPTDGGSGTIVLTSAGAHGLTAAQAVTPGNVKIYISAGTGWTPGFYPITALDLDTTGVAITITGTFNAGMGSPTIALANTEVAVATITIPPLLSDSMIRAHVTQSGTDTSGTAKTVRVRFGTSTMASSTAFYGTGLTTSPYSSRTVYIQNRGATNSQVGGVSASLAAGDGNTTSAPATATVDTTVNTYLHITFQPAAANIVMNLSRYIVEVFK